VLERKWREESHRGAGDSSQRFADRNDSEGNYRSWARPERLTGRAISIGGTTCHCRPNARFGVQPVHQTGLVVLSARGSWAEPAHSMALIGARLGKQDGGRCVILITLYIQTTQDFYLSANFKVRLARAVSWCYASMDVANDGGPDRLGGGAEFHSPDAMRPTANWSHSRCRQLYP